MLKNAEERRSLYCFILFLVVLYVVINETFGLNDPLKVLKIVSTFIDIYKTLPRLNIGG